MAFVLPPGNYDLVTGFDVLLLPDHFGLPAPFPALVSAAEATNLRVGPLVLNGCLYLAPLLARDVMETARLTGDRLELGTGTGYAAWEFAAVGKPFPSGGGRVEALARLVAAPQTSATRACSSVQTCPKRTSRASLACSPDPLDKLPTHCCAAARNSGSLTSRSLNRTCALSAGLLPGYADRADHKTL